MTNVTITAQIQRLAAEIAGHDKQIVAHQAKRAEKLAALTHLKSFPDLAPAKPVAATLAAAKPAPAAPAAVKAPDPQPAPAGVSTK